MRKLLLAALIWPLAGFGQTSGVLREVYTEINGGAVSDLTSSPNFPNSPTFDEVITTGFEAPVDVMDYYGQRMTAYVIAPTTGDYTFWIASDDASALFLSTDESPAHKREIASVPEWTSSREWTKYGSQVSAPIALTGGRKYYLEALMKEGEGGDNLAVRWQLPSGTIEEPIPNNRLEVFGLGPPQIAQQPAPVTVAEGGSATFTVQLVRSTGATYQWQRNGVTIPGATLSSYTRSPAALSDNNSRYRCAVTNSYGGLLSNEALLTVQADTTRPTIVSLSALGDSQTLTVLFSEPVEQASGTKASNYTINNGVTVTSASYAGDTQTLMLKTTLMSPGVTYTLTVNDVRDRATTPNTILANTQRTFSLDYTPLNIGYVRGTPETTGPCSRNTPLVISEIMYNPPARADGRETEFIEIYNSGQMPENIGEFRLSGDVNYTFPPNTSIPAGGFLVVAPIPADLQAVYGIANVLGGFTNRLNNGGGTIRLRNRGDAVLLQVEFSNKGPWPLSADNAGHSLVLARPSYGEGDPRAWAASDLRGGTPGAAELIGANPYATVTINEILAHTDAPELDYIELFNYSASPVDISGCTLSDRPDTNRFTIPPSTVLPARGFVYYNQNQLGFALSTLGETIYLKNPAGTRVLDAVRFGAQQNGVALGRYPDGAQGFHELTAKTPGTANSRVWLRDVVINEIMCNPISGDDDDEFVELHNKGGSPVDMSGWRFTDGIDFIFATNTTIPANGYLVVAKNSSRLLLNYANLNAGNAVGNYGGSLANGGERIALARVDRTVTTNNNVVVTNTIYIVVDEVSFEDGGRWSRWSDGGGSSLELVDPRSDNRWMANWADSDESSKSDWSLVEHTGVLDHGQGAINELHVLLLGGGECLVDNLEVRESSGANLVANSTFDSGLAGWITQGNHVHSGLSTAGNGYGGSGYALHLRASSGGDNGANRLESDLTASMTDGNTATIRGRARWLKGHPDLIMRLHGNHLEAVGTLPIPKNLGTPGMVNSRYRANLGPAIQNVKHSPVLPAAGQSVLVTAQVSDMDSLASLVLKYRLDPSTNYSSVGMTYNGAGFYSATLPGQSAGSLVAFYIQAVDGYSPVAVATFPAEPNEEEALVRFGDPTPAGGFGVYRLWMTQKNINQWTSREKLSNEALDSTFVYGNQRAIYNAGGRYRGSPFIRPGYNSPTGGRCAYVWSLPDDDQLLGADELNLDSLEPGDRDSTAMREITSFWMAEQLGLAFSYQRYVHTVINGVANPARGIPIYTDTQQPDSAYMRSWFADDDKGEIFKIDDWFEFNDSVGMEFNIDGRLEMYSTTGGAKKQARYRWSWEKKFNRTLDDNYTNLFSLVDAMNAPDATYISQVENTIDVDDWITVFALRHAIGDWDGYGYSRGKNQFTYKPTGDKWRMLLWDLDFSLGCNGGHGPTQDLFTVNDPTIARLYNHPHFRRAYFNALYQIAYGPFESANVVPVITARYNALQANSVSTTSPFVGSGAQGISIPDWISQRRDYIIGELSTIPTGFAITSNNGNNFSSATNYLTLTGTAPIAVKTIEVNGVAHPIIWTSLNTWTIRIALAGAANNLTVTGLDHRGQLVAGAQDTITINYTGTVQQPQDFVLINEIMYNPLTPQSAFVELYNRSTLTAFDLSGYHVNGADFTFAEGTIIPPDAYLVVANNVAGFIAAYGNQVPISGVMNGKLDNGGETLTLIKPGATPAQDVIIDAVSYDDDWPWPGLADGFGPSLQLIDAAQDNGRVANWAAIPGSSGGGTQTLIGMTDTWRFRQDGVEPGAGWQNLSFPDSGWPSGAALLYLEESALPAPKNTLLTQGAITFYFRKAFTFTGNPATTTLQVNTIIDDGAVFYLNGVEVLRLGMPEGDITYDIFANRSVNNAVLEGPFTISSASLVQGNNVLAVEVHQINSGSSDIVFGMTLEASSNADKPYTPGAANSVRTTLSPFPLVWLNEVQPNNLNGRQDNYGDRDPWVELYNSGGSSVDLSGYYLSNDSTNAAKWAFPGGTMLNSGQYRLVWLDNEPGETASGHLHANFRAPPTNGSIVLTKVSGSVTSVVDYLTYKPINNDRSYGAYPDGSAVRRQTFYFATPEAANNTNFPATPIYINEWMAGNNSTVADPADGDFEDWFELFNAAPVDIDLSGFYLTDDLLSPTKWTIPNGTTIPADGYLLIWADDEEETQNAPGEDLHASFKLGLTGDAIGLFAPNGSLVNSVTFPQQTNDVSQGRWPNGNSSVYFMTMPTPENSNVYGTVTNSPPILSSIGNRAGNEGSLITFTAAGVDPDAGQNLTFTLAPGFPAGASINADSGVFTWTPSESQGPGSYAVTVRVTDDGTPAMSDSEAITLTVGEVNAAPALAPVGNRTVSEGTLLTFTAVGSDSDLPEQTLSFSLDTGAPMGAAINPADGTFTWTPTEAQGPGAYEVTVIVSDNGSPSLNVAETITVTVGEANSAPVLAGIGNKSVNEGSALSFTLSAADPDLPAQSLTYSMDAGAPTGASFNPATRTFAWTPTEAQGPGTYNVTFRAADNGSPTLNDSETITITVAEVNSAPVLAGIGNKSVNEGSALSFTLSAADPDLPAQSLTYSMDAGAPTGASFNPATRTFAWTPTEAQGPGTYNVTFRATDNGSPALNDSETITITVAEINSAPVLAGVGNKSVNEGSALSFTISATDPDLPAQDLTYSMDAGTPTGASFNPATRTFTWTPAEAQGPGTYNVTFRATDNGSPTLNDSETITVTVAEINSAPVLAGVGNKSVNEGSALSFTISATDPDLPAQNLTYSMDAGAPTGASFNPATRMFTWTPTEAQGPGTFNVTLRVTDNGSPALNDSETITVTVAEINSAPVLAGIADQNVIVGAQLVLTNSASDPDIPTNILTYSLEPGAPVDATIDAVSGVFMWTPASAGTNSITVRVTDNSSPELSDAKSFVITATTQPELRIASITAAASGDVTLTWRAQAGEKYRVGYKNLLGDTAWASAGEFTAEGLSMTVTLSGSPQTQRYYRLEIVRP